MPPEDAVAAIVRDLEDRGGLGDEWGQIDPLTKQEIIEKWTAIVRDLAADILRDDPRDMVKRADLSTIAEIRIEHGERGLDNVNAALAEGWRLLDFRLSRIGEPPESFLIGLDLALVATYAAPE